MPTLANHNECTGCASCLNICAHDAIQMKEDLEGFLFPCVDVNRCIECGACTKSCPIISNINDSFDEVPLVYAMWSNIDRNLSSSGGAFSVIARYVLGLNGVVFGAALNNEMECRHQLAKSVDALRPIRGSKYIQSNIGISFREVKKILSEDTLVLFTGTPCQIAGLKAFLKRPYSSLITVDLVCHGVPSNAVFKSYIEKLKKNRPDFVGIEGFEFRRFDGWGYAPSVKLSSKLQQVFGVDNLYMEAFEKGAIFRKSCYHCKYAKIPRVGDITIADFWGIGKHGTPFKHNTSNGVSLLLVNSDLGQHIVSKLSNCYMEERTLEEAVVENPNINNSTAPNAVRHEVISAFMDVNAGLYDIEKTFHLVNRSLKGRIKRVASQYGIFNVAKYFYDALKSL